MQIGFIGAGHIGGTLAKLLVKLGHDVAISNSRNPSTLKNLTDELGPHGRAVTPAEAAHFGELVVVSVPFGRYREIPAEHLAGKIVIDSNNYYPNRDGHFEELDADRTTSSELLQAHLPGARVVKAFNTMSYQTLGTEGRPSAPLEDRLALFIAGDDVEAKATVAGLIQELGFGAVDTGTLSKGGRKQQPGTPIYGRPMPVSEALKALAKGP